MRDPVVPSLEYPDLHIVIVCDTSEMDLSYHHPIQRLDRVFEGRLPTMTQDQLARVRLVDWRQGPRHLECALLDMIIFFQCINQTLNHPKNGDDWSRTAHSMSKFCLLI
jgi:hypothetical protein